MFLEIIVPEVCATACPVTSVPTQRKGPRIAPRAFVVPVVIDQLLVGSLQLPANAQPVALTAVTELVI